MIVTERWRGSLRAGAAHRRLANEATLRLAAATQRLKPLDIARCFKYT